MKILESENVQESSEILLSMLKTLKDYCEGKIHKKGLMKTELGVECSRPTKYSIHSDLNLMILNLEIIQFTKHLLTLPEEMHPKNRQNCIDIILDWEKEIELKARERSPREFEIDNKTFNEQFFTLVAQGITKIKLMMKEQSKGILTIQRHNIQNILNQGLFMVSDNDGYLTFRSGVQKIFELMGILTIVNDNVIKFLKISQEAAQKILQ